MPSLAVLVPDGMATMICPSHLSGGTDCGMEADDSGPVMTSSTVMVPNFFENQTRLLFEEVIQELDNAINKGPIELNSNSKLSPAVGTLEGWVNILDNFKSLDKGNSFNEVISIERIEMGNLDSQQRNNNSCILEAGFSVGIPPCPSGRKTGGRNKVLDGMATMICPSHLSGGADCGMEAEDSSPVMTSSTLMDSKCEGCGLEAETPSNLFWSCHWACEFWSCLKLTLPFKLDQSYSFKDLLWKLAMKEYTQAEIIVRFVIGAWCLWSHQNEVHAGGDRKEGAILMKKAMQYLEKYNATLEQVKPASVPGPQEVSWCPPTTPKLEVNVDGATFSTQGAIGIGVIVWNDKGEMLAALSRRLNEPLGVVEVEAKAFEAGAQFAKDIRIQDFILKGDSVIIHHALVDLSPPPSSVDLVVQGILTACGEFRQMSFSRVPHQGNRPAHLLAKTC
nr:hypothetical protein CFP56_32841 [Quercus suber]